MVPSAPYELLQVLYEVRDLAVYRGRRKIDGAPVRLKLLRAGGLDHRQLARLRHEHLVTRDLDVPCVLRALGIEQVGSATALVMEDFEGQPLSDLVRQGRPDLRTTLRIAAAIAGAIGEIHARHVIHKDIKPHNILVDPATGALKLMDFGIAARLSEETPDALRPEWLEGTPAYMSPEQTGRMNRVVDDRTDLYSLGVTLYEMLTGVRPFPATDAAELVYSHLARTPAPPHERSPDVPPAVSSIVMKLLAKDPEDRYQGAYGVKADLEECLSRLDAEGAIAPFPLGRHDVTSVLRVPQKLYGREEESRALLAVFERCQSGGVELVTLSGHAGVGKTALVREIRGPILQRGGYFVAGKFDQLGRNAPYAGVVRALRELLRQILSEPEEDLARWRGALLEALGPNGQLVVDLVPELEQILGPQPPVPALGPTESQNRFQLVLQSFLCALASPERPLALFLDDLHWADPASLKLLQLVLTDPGARHLLIVGAYRDHEVGTGHLLTLALSELRGAGARVSEIALRPLDRAHVGQFLADALGRPAEGVAPLAALAFDKTHGNPFFLGQLLKELSAEGLICFDMDEGAFGWDLESIRAHAATDNVVEFMARKVKGLPEATRRALQLGACVGHSFDLGTLSLISEAPPRQVAAALWEALRQGLVLPLDADYKHVAGAEGEDELEAPEPSSLDVRYRFLHDRVQQAAYGLIPEAERPRLHLKVGRLLLAQAGERAREERLFEILDHLNQGSPHIEDPAERLRLAGWNLAAGRRAKAGTAYEAAARYLRAGAGLLGERGWEDAHEVSFALHKELAECEHLSGRREEAEALFGELLARARTRLDRAGIHLLLVALHFTGLRIAESIGAGCAGLALYGVRLPETEEELGAASAAEMEETGRALASRSIEDLRQAPVAEDPEHVVQLKLLAALVPPTGVQDFRLLLWVVLKLLNLGLRYGHADVSCYAYALYGAILCAGFARYEEARRPVELALALEEKIGSLEHRSKVFLVLAGVLHFFEPLDRVIACYERARRAGLESGDIIHGCFAASELGWLRTFKGEELPVVRPSLEKELAFAQRVKEGLAVALITLNRQTIANLEGCTLGRGTLSDGAFVEEEWFAGIERAGNEMVLPRYFAAKLLVSCLHGDHAAALEAATLAEQRLGISAGLHFATEIQFYAGLALAASHGSAPAGEQERIAAQLAEREARLAVLAGLCPESHQHEHLLLRAEAARISGRHGDARELYDEAIASARAHGFVSVEAIASELAGRFYLGKGNEGVAGVYLAAARHAYLRWGATAKVDDLVEAYPALLARAAAGAEADSTSTTTGASLRMDLAAVLKAAQALAGEIVLDRLVERVMRVVTESAGAQRAVLMLSRDGELRIAARTAAEAGGFEVGLAEPALESEDVPASVVQVVARTGEPLVLGDAAGDGRFARDRYVASRRPRSILCVAMLHQGRLSGVLYLENAAASGAFTPSRVSFAGLIAAQAAIAVENALLIEGIRQRSERLEAELLERRRAEEARAALEEELVRVQTPLIPITDRIMVMPLIGAIDERRAAHLLEAALEGAHASHTEVVILDVTGVQGIDAAVTSWLVRAAQALELLGVQAVITGMRAEVARQLVELGVDLGPLLTLRTLQHGVRYALARQGRRSAATPGRLPS